MEEEISLIEAMRKRHAVRRYLDKPIEDEKKEAIRKKLEEVNQASGFHFQVFFDEPEAFEGNEPSYGSFSHCKNYFALVGKKSKDEDVGYYGEQLVLFLTQIGLASCWVAMTFEKSKVKPEIGKDEKLYILVAFGYGENEGVPHKSKISKKVAAFEGDDPEWFVNGVTAALLAPTAINQQKFYLERNGDEVSLKDGIGFYTKIDKGIVKYHFELGAGKENFHWKK